MGELPDMRLGRVQVGDADMGGRQIVVSRVIVGHGDDIAAGRTPGFDAIGRVLQDNALLRHKAHPLDGLEVDGGVGLAEGNAIRALQHLE